MALRAGPRGLYFEVDGYALGCGDFTVAADWGVVVDGWM